MMDGLPLQKSPGVFLHLLRQKKATVVVYILLFIIAALVITTLAGLVLTPALILWVKAAEIFLFARLGVLNGKLAKKYLPVYNKHPEYALFFSLLVAILICIALSLFYALSDRNLLLMAFACGSAFFMPALIAYSLFALESFPEKQYQPWYVDEITENTVSIFLNSIRIEIQLAKKYFDISDTIYSVTVPVQTPFGKFFNRFISEKNRLEPNSIELKDSKRKRVGWEFYVEGLGGLRKKHIDPNLTLVENRVKQNTKIIAKRISNIKKYQSLIPETIT